MIFAKLSDAPLYRGINPRLDRALDLLTDDFLSSVGTERMPLEGTDLYVTRYERTTYTDESRLFEFHRDYLDIFLLLKGEEREDFAASEAVAVCKQHDDYWGGPAAAAERVILRPGSFVVFFPGEAHRPGMAVDAPQEVSRIVFKIRLRES